MKMLVLREWFCLDDCLCVCLCVCVGKKGPVICHCLTLTLLSRATTKTFRITILKQPDSLSELVQSCIMNSSLLLEVLTWLNICDDVKGKTISQ